MRFFSRFPLPQDLHGQSTEDLARTLQELAGRHLGSARKSLGERGHHILVATAALQTQPRDRSLALKAELIRQLCEEILTNLERTRRLERLLHDQLLPATGQKLESVPGIGTLTAATILGEIGEVQRFPNRHAFAKYNGTAPASKSTGGRQRHTARRGCNHRLKRALWLIALTAVRSAGQSLLPEPRRKRPEQGRRDQAGRPANVGHRLCHAAHRRRLRSKAPRTGHRQPPSRGVEGRRHVLEGQI